MKLLPKDPYTKSKEQAGGELPHNPADTYWHSVPFLIGDAGIYDSKPDDGKLTDRLTTEGIAGDIRQAEVLRALGPTPECPHGYLPHTSIR